MHALANALTVRGLVIWRVQKNTRAVLRHARAFEFVSRARLRARASAHAHRLQLAPMLPAYLRCALILSMPALAQASSSSMPGPPETPMPPTTSLPALMRRPPTMSEMRGNLPRPPALARPQKAVGFAPIRFTMALMLSSLWVAPMVTTV